MTPFERRRVRLALLAVFSVHGALATPVTLTAKSAAGAAAADTIVVLDPLEGTPPPTHASASIDQINKRFVPRVSVVRTGTAVSFPNSDNIRHQVYSFSPAKIFSMKLYAGSPRIAVVFDKPGLVVLGCNIHDTMVGFIGVVDSPFFGKIPQTGSVVLDVPAGRYTLHVWHPLLAAAQPPQQIDVAAAPLAVALTVELDPGRETVAAWPE